MYNLNSLNTAEKTNKHVLYWEQSNEGDYDLAQMC